MPTFYLSDDEIRTLVLFFQAMSAQPQPFIPQKVAPLDPDGDGHGSQPVHESGRAMLEVPRDRRSGARQERHRAEFPARAAIGCSPRGPSAGSPIRRRLFPARRCLQAFSGATAIAGFLRDRFRHRSNITRATRRIFSSAICSRLRRKSKPRLSATRRAAADRSRAAGTSRDSVEEGFISAFLEVIAGACASMQGRWPGIQ